MSRMVNGIEYRKWQWLTALAKMRGKMYGDAVEFVREKRRYLHVCWMMEQERGNASEALGLGPDDVRRLQIIHELANEA